MAASTVRPEKIRKKRLAKAGRNAAKSQIQELLETEISHPSNMEGYRLVIRTEVSFPEFWEDRVFWELAGCEEYQTPADFHVSETTEKKKQEILEKWLPMIECSTSRKREIVHSAEWLHVTEQSDAEKLFQIYKKEGRVGGPMHKMLQAA